MLKNIFKFLFFAGIYSANIFASEPALQIWDNNSLCGALAEHVGNAYLHSGTNKIKILYCRDELKKNMVFPASTCELSKMIDQCLLEIEKTQKSH